MNTLSEVFDKVERAEHIATIAHLLPLNDRVLLRRFEEEDGLTIKIADAYQAKSNRGSVLAIGKDAVGQLKIGDKVVFGHYSAQDITVDGEDLVLISIHDVWLRL